MAAVWESNRLVTHIAYLEGAKVDVDVDAVQVGRVSKCRLRSGNGHQGCQSAARDLWGKGSRDSSVQRRGSRVGYGAYSRGHVSSRAGAHLGNCHVVCTPIHASHSI